MFPGTRGTSRSRRGCLAKRTFKKKTKQCCSKREDSQLRHKFDPNYAHSVGSHAYLLTPEMRWVVKKTELKRHIFLTVFSSSHFVHTPGTAAHGLEANRRDRTLPLQCTQCCFEIFFGDTGRWLYKVQAGTRSRDPNAPQRSFH